MPKKQFKTILGEKGKKKDGGDMKKSILDSSGSESEGNRDGDIVFKKKKAPNKGETEMGNQLSINKTYADRYNSWRNLEEMQKLKDRLKVKDVSELDDDGSDSESTSEEEAEWSSEKEKAFFKTLACLKKKDPKIYTDQFGFFKDVNDEDGTQDGGSSTEDKKKKKKKALTVRDHERIMVMEKRGGYSEHDENNHVDKNEDLPKSYNEELASIKTEFSKIGKDIESSEDEDDALLGSTLLKKRVVKSEDQQKDQEEYKLWLKGEIENVKKSKLSKVDKQELKSLKDYWTDDKLDEGEKFLRDYILNKKYIDPLKNEDDYVPSYNEVVHDDDKLSDDEKFESQREEFEHKYNFRFEEPDQEFIKRYPRTIQDSLRREDTSRKDQRQKAKEKKEDTVSKHREEVQRLKAMKRKEILDKIQRLHDITGNADLDVTEMDIDEDFDPEKYDRRMREIFNDQYYKDELDDKKPEFPYDEEIDGDEQEDFENWVPTREGKSMQDTEDKSDESDSNDDDDNSNSHQDHSDEDNDIISQRSRTKKATQNELIEASKGRRGKRKRSAFLDALEREKPKFNPKVHKSFEEYFDEYYKLDFEDVVGDLKCRFKYHKTTPNNFGLSMEEILNANDRELNQWASLKKTYQYRGEVEEAYEVKAYKEKSKRKELKKRILPSVYETQPENNEVMEVEDVSLPKKKHKKKKNKNKADKNDVVEDASVLVNEDEQADSGSISSSLSPKKTKMKNKNKTDEKIDCSVDNSTALANEKEQVNSKSVSEKNAKKKYENRDTKHNKNDDLPPTMKEKHPTPISTGLSKRQRKNQKKKMRADSGADSPVKSIVNLLPENKESNGISKDRKEKSKINHNKPKVVKRKMHESKESSNLPVEEDRLRAYGINPTKFKKRMKYGTSANKA